MSFLERFTGRAAAYSTGRPGYPHEILDILNKEVGFDRAKIVADVGSGTGLLSKLFLENGNRVYAVEPNEEMRLIAESTLANFPRLVSIKARAESTTLGDAAIDLVAVGQALHWFDFELAGREFARILRSNGNLCVLYNDRNKESEFMKAYDGVIQKYARDRAKVPIIDHDFLSKFYNGGKYSKFLLLNEQLLDLDGLFGRMTSASYMPGPSETQVFRELHKDVSEIFRSYDTHGRVKLAYDTSIFLGSPRRWDQ